MGSIVDPGGPLGRSWGALGANLGAQFHGMGARGDSLGALAATGVAQETLCGASWRAGLDGDTQGNPWAATWDPLAKSSEKHGCF